MKSIARSQGVSLFDGKICTQCREWFLIGTFAPIKRGEREYRHSWCNRCRVKFEQARAKADPEKYKASYSSEKRKAQTKAWREANLDKSCSYTKKWRVANPEKAKHTRKQGHYRKKNAEGTYTFEEWKALCDSYDNRCLRCGEQKPLTVDHVIPLIDGGRNDITNLQPLCRSCNCKKRTRHWDYRIHGVDHERDAGG